MFEFHEFYQVLPNLGLLTNRKKLFLINSMLSDLHIYFLGRRLTFFDTVVDVYKPSVIANKEKFLGFLKAKTEEASKTKLADKLTEAIKYYKLEMSAPKLKSLDIKKILDQGEIEQLVKDVNLVKECFRSGCYWSFTVKQALLLILVGIEIIMWFFLGETIGKMHIVGYKVDD